MNASMKKLLSMLVVMAMVFSMVPTFTLPAIAAETETASTTVTPGQANLPEGIQEIIDEAAKVVNTDEAIDAHISAGTCPMCGATGITWDKKMARHELGGTQNQSYHYVYDGAFTATGNLVGLYNSSTTTSSNNTVCIALKSTAVITNDGTRLIMLSGTNNVINIMGSGTATTDVGTKTDYGMFQIGSGTLNLYGGTFILKDSDGTGKYAAIRANGGDVNIYNDTIIGPAEADTTLPLYNVTFKSASSEVNMYGGTIRNGVTAKNGLSGNVTVAQGTFNMYGGTISGGQYLAGDGITSPASVGGNVIVGGLAEDATATTTGKFYMYGGTITGGKAYNGGNGGGNINCYNTGAGNIMELMGGTIKDGYARAAGGNVQIQGGTAHKIGGTVLITNGQAASGGNIQIAASRKLTMEGGYVQGGTLAAVGGTTKNANNGGAVYVAGTFEMTGGEIDGCKVSGNGGNIYAAGGATVTIGANATIKNGLSTTAANGGGGGNIYMTASATAGSTVTTEGTITGGTVNGGSSSSASSGGNISVVANGAIQSVLTVNGGTIADGTVTYNTAGSAFGGNIRAYNCKVVINDGLIYNGNAGSKANGSVGVMGGTSTSANTNATLEINGGIIVGGVTGCQQKTNTESTNAAGTTTYNHTCSITLTGSPKILRSYKVSDTVTSTAVGGYGLTVSNNYPLDISGLEQDAEIWVTGSTLDMVFTKAYDGTADLLSCFHHTYTGGRAVGLTEDGTQLKVIEYTEPVQTPVKGTFNPWDCDDMAYCDACLAQGKSDAEALVAWTAYDGTNTGDDTALKDGPHHLYLAADTTYSSGNYLCTYTDVCFNLNGCDVTASSGASSAFFAASTATINLFDSEGDAVVTGYKNNASAGAAIAVNGGNAGATINIYSGTYTKLDSDVTSPIVMIGANGGTINMYGGTIDATGKEIESSTMTGCAVTVRGGGEGKEAVFNMEGGEIKGGTAIQGGSVMVGVYSTTALDCATFNLKGGKISGGTVVDILNTDGSVKTAGAGGNFSVQYGGVLNVSGGTICNGTVTGTTSGSSWGGNIRAYNGNVNISGGLIYGGTGGKTIAGANVSVYSDATGRAANRGKLSISGGTIVGDLAITYGSGEGFLTLSGAPTIVTSMEIDGETVNAVHGGLYINGYQATISDLSAEADIAVTAAKNTVLTYAHENAANVVGCFKPTDTAYTVALQDDNTLKVVENAPELDKFEPEKYSGLAYCPVCYENGKHTEPVEWIAITSETAAFRMAAGAHYYVAEDITNASRGTADAYIQGSYAPTNTNCLNLNGKELTVTDGRALFAATSVFNIMDTEGTAVVSGNLSNSGNACTLLLNSSMAGAVVNIYGGTFTKPTTNTTSSIVSIQPNGGTINMYGGCIDGTGCTTTKYPTGVYLIGGIYNADTNPHGGLATFNMYGGEIKGGTTTAKGGNVLVGDYNNNTTLRLGTATFNMEGGTISGGTAASGGNVSTICGGKFVMTDGTVSGGTANSGGNINGDGGTTIDIQGGTICNGTIVNTNSGGYGNWGGNIRSYQGTVKISGGLIYGGVDPAGNNQFANVGVYSDSADKTVSVLEISGNPVIVGDIGVGAPHDVKDSSTGEVKNYCYGSTVKLSGSPTIVTSYELENGTVVEANYGYGFSVPVGTTNSTVYYTEADITGLTAEANIAINTSVGNILTAEGVDASGLIGCFKVVNTGLLVEVNDAKQLVVVKGNAGIVTEEGTIWYSSTADAVAAYTGEGWLRPNSADVTFTLTDKEMDYYIDFRQFDNVSVEGQGNLYPMDSQNDDFVGAAIFTVTGDVQVIDDVTGGANGYRYITIQENGGYSAHRVEIQLSAVTLRAPAAGLYYKAQYKCDNVLAGRVMGYGVALSTDAMPGEDFLDVNEFTMYDGSEFNPEDHTVNTTSGSVFGILKEPGTDGRTAKKNDEGVQTKIYANPYLAIDLDGSEDLDKAVYFLGDTKNGGKTTADEGCEKIGYSLLDVLKAVDNEKIWNSLSDKQKQMVQTNVTTWIDWLKEGTDDFSATLTDNLTNIA